MTASVFDTCLEACNACAAASSHCAIACLREEDPKPMARCIALDMDCAAACALAAGLVARASTQAAAACRFCSEVCEACAAECGQHDMDHCQACAAACRECAEACRAFSNLKG